MDRPPLEVADLVRAAGDAFIERSRKWITWKHVKVLLAIARCRTAALGGHLDECTRCGHRAISYNSCRNRHCPKCQAGARERWLEKRRRELLPTSYVHVVFTLPRQLAPLTLQNKKVVYDLLFRTSAETLLEVARDPKHLGAEIGFFSVLHSWSQKLELHPHVHCVVPAGGLSADHSRWIKPHYAFFLPVKVLSRVFRGKFVAALQQAFQDGRLSFHGDLQPLTQPKTFVEQFCPPVQRCPTGVAAHRPSVYRLVVRVLLDTLHGAPVCADRQVDPPVRFHTPATSRRLFRGKLYAEVRKSYRGVIRRSSGGAER